eukprot:366228-Chlamydomonas_euryale.AAC.34
MLFCSSVPISSTAPVATWRTGRTMRAACVKRKSPGKGPPCSGRMSASSRCIGTCSSPGRSESSSSGSAAELLAIACTAALMARRRATTMGADAERTLPTSRPSRVTGRYSGGGGGVVAGAHGTMPRDARICTHMYAQVARGKWHSVACVSRQMLLAYVHDNTLMRAVPCGRPPATQHRAAPQQQQGRSCRDRQQTRAIMRTRAGRSGMATHLHQHRVRLLRLLRPMRDDLAGGRKVVEKAAGAPVWSVHRAHEAPRLGQQLAHRRGAQLCKVGAAMHRPEVGQVAEEVELLGNYREASRLRQVEPALGHQVAGVEQVLKFLAHVGHLVGILTDGGLVVEGDALRRLLKVL